VKRLVLSTQVQAEIKEVSSVGFKVLIPVIRLQIEKVTKNKIKFRSGAMH
jgi:hypothetical protein